MAQRLVGLIGAGIGPLLTVRGEVRVEVRGLETDDCVQVEILDELRRELTLVPGTHSLGYCDRLRFSYEGSCKTTSCHVFMEN